MPSRLDEAGQFVRIWQGRREGSQISPPWSACEGPRFIAAAARPVGTRLPPVSDADTHSLSALHCSPVCTPTYPLRTIRVFLRKSGSQSCQRTREICEKWKE